VAGAALALALTGCGGDEEAPRVRMNIESFRFRPPEIAVPAGRQVTLPVRNRATVVHNLSIPDIGADFDYRPGQSSNFIFIAPESGRLEFFCKYHRDQGMTGVFFVRP
jgi:plastocyanin